MEQKQSIYKKVRTKVKSNQKLDLTLHYLFVLFMVTLSAFLFALSFRLFISPHELKEGQVYFVSGGISGLSQNIVKIVIDIFKVPNVNKSLLQGILYFILNIPVILLGWFKIGHRFTIFTVINVALTSLFISVLPQSIEQIVMLDSQLTRTLFAGILSGFSAAASFKAETSSGGIDVISYYFANRKSKGVGKYSIIFNSVIVITFVALDLIEGKPVAEATTGLIYSIIYLVTSAFVIDSINIRNKKTQLQIFTDNPNLAHILIENFPHGATTVDAIGAYSGNKKTIVYMTLSTTEVKSAVSLIQEKDPNAFINVIELRQVYGRFFIPPVK